MVGNEQPENPAFEKEVIRLPDGRELTYYRFPEKPPLPAERPAGPAPRRKER